MKPRYLLPIIIALSSCAGETLHVDASGGLILRSAPSTSAEAITTIPDNEPVTVEEQNDEQVEIGGRSGSWTRVSYQEQIGWVFGGFLTNDQALIAAKGACSSAGNVWAEGSCRPAWTKDLAGKTLPAACWIVRALPNQRVSVQGANSIEPTIMRWEYSDAGIRFNTRYNSFEYKRKEDGSFVLIDPTDGSDYNSYLAGTGC